MKWILIIMIWHGAALEQIEQGKYSSADDCVKAGFALSKGTKWFCKTEDGLQFDGPGNR